MVIYDLAHILMSLIDEFILLAHKQTQFVSVLKLLVLYNHRCSENEREK